MNPAPEALPGPAPALPPVNMTNHPDEPWRPEPVLTSSQWKMVRIDSIGELNARMRTLREENIAELKLSIQQIGLVNPITVSDVDIPAGSKFALITGKHRLEACRALGWTEIPAMVAHLSDIDGQLTEIDENLIRAELTELERGEHDRQKKLLYEQRFPETKKGVAGGKARQGSASAKLSFAEDTAKKTGRSRRSVERGVHRAEHLAPGVKEKIRDMPKIADTGTELDALAALKPDEQIQAVEAVKSGVIESVRDFNKDIATENPEASRQEPDSGAGVEPEPEPERRKPMSNYVINLRCGVLKEDAVDSKIRKAFGVDDEEGDLLGPSLSVVKVKQKPSKGLRLEEARAAVIDIVNELKGELEDRRDNFPENMQGSSKFEEIETAISEMEELEAGLQDLNWSVEFPGF